MTTVTASYDTLMHQTPGTVAIYLAEAIEMLDRKFGKGYAEEHPDLLGVLVTAMVKEFSTASFGVVIGEVADRLSGLSSALEEGFGYIGGVMDGQTKL